MDEKEIAILKERRELDVKYRDITLKMLSEILHLLTKKQEEDKWFDIHEASNYANVSPSSLRRYYTAGKLKVSNNLGKTLIRKSEIDNFLSGVA